MTLSTETKRGSNCTGTDGTTSRVLTLANTTLTSSGGFQVNVNGLQLVPTTEYTVSHLTANSTITFLNFVWDSDYITVIYLQTGGTPLSASYCTYTDVYTRTGLSTTEVSSTIVDELIIDAEAELEMLIGRKFTNANSTTEFLSIKDKDIIGNYQTSFSVSKWPIQSVSVCNLLDQDDNVTTTFDTLTSAEIVAGTYDSEDYWLDVQTDPVSYTVVPNGRFILKEQTLPKGTNNVKVTYTYGYASIPRVITNLAASMAGIRAWLVFLGCGYNKLNSYSIPQQNVNKGDFYTRGMQNIENLTNQCNALLDRIGRKPRTLFYATGGDR